MLKGKPEFAQEMLTPWRSLAWLSTVEAWKYSSPSESLFESYVAISEHIHRPRSLVRAHLDLHHPSKPSDTLAVEFLSKESFWQNLLSSTSDTLVSGPKPQPSNFHVRIMSFGLDTVQHLTQRGQSDEAQWILGLLRTYLGPYFSQDQPHHDPRFSLG